MKTNERVKKIIFLTISSVIIVSGLWFGAFVMTASSLEKDRHQEAGGELVNEEEDASEEEDEWKDWVDWELSEPETHINILLLGLDNHGMSDAIMIFSYDLETYDSAIIAIKRDTYVGEQNWAEDEPGASQLTYAHLYGMGPEENYHHGALYALLWIEYLLELPLHGYASITFDGFTELIDQIGGVTVNVDPGFAERNKDPLPPGMQTLDGQQALTYARHRSNPRIQEPGSESEDGDRIRRNQHLFQAVLERCKELEEDELNDVYENVQDNLHTSLDDWDLMTIVNIYYHTDPSDMTTAILPGKPVYIEEKIGVEPTYYYLLDEEKTDHLLKDLGLK